MIGNLEKLEKELFQYKVVNVEVEEINQNSLKYSHPFIGVHSVAFGEYIVHFNRIILIYSAILDSMKNNKKYKYYTFTQIAIILSITSLEIYLNKLFLHLLKIISIENIRCQDFQKLLKRYGIKIKDTEGNNKGLGEKEIFSLLPERLRFQNKKNVKRAFKLFDIELNKINEDLFGKIYYRDEKSYMKLRHRIVHGKSEGIFFAYELIDIETVENCMLDIAKFIYLIDKYIVKKYPELEYYHTFFRKTD